MVLFFLGANTYVSVFFLPFWFQGVKGISPVSTGVDFIPLLLSQLVSLIVVGAIVKQFGLYVPYMIAGELICIGGQAMLTQIRRDTSTLYWAASFVVSGLGPGMAMQLPYTAVAVVLSDDDIPVGNAIAVLFYQLGGAIFISTGQTVIITTILDLDPQRLPGLPAGAVLAAGAANLPTLAQSPEQLVVLQDIWNSAIVRTIIMTTAVVGAAVPFTLGMEWLNAVKVAEKRKNVTIEATDSEKANGDNNAGKASGDVGAPPEHGDAGQVA
ncbi:efflux pump antibiotic resistance protein [Apiospora aurea]|uniref:Efflux pump antibiotic resistance protein n=1 Tax=Apiospora aurea TaxID=335848 RepID=A0ABR1QA08_9PEZI